MDRLRKLLKLLLTREHLPEEAPAPRPSRANAPGLGALLFGRETLPEDAPAPARAPGFDLGHALWGRETLPLDPVDPPASKTGAPGLGRALFGLERLPVDPLEAARPPRPVLKWLLWPESISSSDPKKPGES